MSSKKKKKVRAPARSPKKGKVKKHVARKVSAKVVDRVRKRRRRQSKPDHRKPKSGKGRKASKRLSKKRARKTGHREAIPIRRSKTDQKKDRKKTPKGKAPATGRKRGRPLPVKGRPAAPRKAPKPKRAARGLRREVERLIAEVVSLKRKLARKKRKAPSRRVVPLSAGLPTGEMKPRVWEPTEKQKKARLEETREMNRLRYRLRRLAEKNKRAKELAALKKFRSTDKDAQVMHGMLSWMNVFQDRSRQIGLRVGITQAINRDGTSSMQLITEDWKEPYKEQIFRLVDSIQDFLPTLPAGVKVRCQVRLAFREKSGEAAYVYLPSIMGQRAIYFTYVDPRSVGTLFFKVENSIDSYTKDTGAELAALTVDLRFEPRWVKE